MTKEERKKEPKDYRNFVYIEPDTLLDTSINKDIYTPKSFLVIELQEVLTESQGPQSQSETTEPTSTKSEGPEPQIEQSEPEVEIQNEYYVIQSKGKELVLAKYVTRHHAQIRLLEINHKVL